MRAAVELEQMVRGAEVASRCRFARPASSVACSTKASLQPHASARSAAVPASPPQRTPFLQCVAHRCVDGRLASIISAMKIAIHNPLRRRPSESKKMHSGLLRLAWMDTTCQTCCVYLDIRACAISRLRSCERSVTAMAQKIDNVADGGDRAGGNGSDPEPRCVCDVEWSGSGHRPRASETRANGARLRCGSGRARDGTSADVPPTPRRNCVGADPVR